MDNLTHEQKIEILDLFGKELIEKVRDMSLKHSINIAKYETKNSVALERYKSLSSLSEEEQEAVCDLLSETVLDTIYNFLEMFEEDSDKMELIIKKDNVRYNMCDISEKMGSEIACFNDEGWIQKFSKVGRFIL